jgi:hypothetical protein
VLEALRQAVPESGEDVPPNTYSGTEIREAMCIGHEKFHTYMTAWIRSGKVSVVQIRRRALDGRMARTRAYQFVV